MGSRKSKPAFYAVHKGRVPGVYLTWDECKLQIDGFASAKFKKFPSREEAERWAASGDNESLFVSSGSSGEAGPSMSIDSASSSSGVQIDYDLKGKKRASEDLTKWPDHVGVDEKENGKQDWPPIEVYCDGACKGNGQAGSVAGIGVYWGPGDERNIYERCPGDQTNNRAELVAIARVLETTFFTKNKLIIKTDSKYSIKCLTQWIHEWRRNNWHTASNQPVKNAPLIQYVATLLEYRVRYGQQVLLQHVEAHVGLPGNEGADMLANRGTLEPEMKERDWVSLEADYRRRAEENIARVEARRMRKRAKMELASQDHSTVNVSQVEDFEGAAVHPRVAAVSREQLGRRVSAGVVELSEEDLAAYADVQDDDDEDVPSPPITVSTSTSGSRQPSASTMELSREDLEAFADVWEDNVELSE